MKKHKEVLERPKNRRKSSVREVRRSFFTKIAATSAIAPIVGAPMIAVAKSPIVFKMQGAWGGNDIMN